jgi:signal peptidase I
MEFISETFSEIKRVFSNHRFILDICNILSMILVLVMALISLRLVLNCNNPVVVVISGSMEPSF